MRRDTPEEDRYVAAKAMDKSRQYAAIGDRKMADAYSELANWCIDDMEKRGEINNGKRRG